MNNEPNWVSDEQRRNNSRAVRRRDTWRRQYKDVVHAIKVAKSRLRMSDKFGAQEVQYYRSVIHSLRDRASGMMDERLFITEALRYTSYPYAERR
jgi:hypothetical protein